MPFRFPVFAPHFSVLTAAVTLGLAGSGGAPARAQQQAPAGVPAPASFSRNTFSTYGAADLRVRETDKEGDRSYIAATRLTTDWVRRDPTTGLSVAGARIQFYVENGGQRDITGGSRFRPGELYGQATFRLPALSLPARLTAGQFPLPFGLTALYDPLQPIQPLYEKSLGLRLDTGLLLEGDYAPYRYAVALTTGAGPNRFDGTGTLVSFRLERTVATELGRFIIGGSLLSGRAPVTTYDTQLPASGTTRARRFVDRTRFGADGQYLFGPVTLRGELVFGGDGPDAAWGYFAEGNYAATDRLTLVAMRRLWNFADSVQVASSTGIGANYNVGRGFTLRALYEFQRDVPLPAGTPPRIAKRLTLQTRLNF